MAIDLERLLAAISEDDPTGPDLAYDPERQEIEQAFDTSVSGENTTDTVDWRKIIGLIENQSNRTKDIWLAVYLCRAGARSGQIEIVETGALYLSGLLERYWDTLNPKLDEYGYQGRKGPCESLTRVTEFLGPLRRAILIEHPRLGRFSGADFERFRVGAEAEEGYGQFRAALQETPDQVLKDISERLSRIAQSIRAADTVLTARAQDDTGVNFSTTYSALTEIQRAVESFMASPPEAEPEADGGESPEPQKGPARSPGRVETREDVFKALDAICDYYHRKEPMSPIPLALKRAREWVTADFMTVLEDIAPDGVEQARRILVSKRE